MGTNSGRNLRIENMKLFAKWIKANYPSNYSILEIACGETPYLSYFLWDMGYRDITAMDKVIDIEYSKYKKIQKSKEQFKITTDTSKFNLIVLRHGCGLTEPVIRNTKKHGNDFASVVCEKPVCCNLSKLEFVQLLRDEGAKEEYIKEQLKAFSPFDLEFKPMCCCTDSREEYIKKLIEIGKPDVKYTEFESVDGSNKYKELLYTKKNIVK